MMQFLQKKIKNNKQLGTPAKQKNTIIKQMEIPAKEITTPTKKIGTPTKKVKPNQHFKPQVQQLSLNLIFLRNISNSQPISLFTLPPDQTTQFQIDGFLSQQNPADQQNNNTEQQQLIKQFPSRLGKKLTMIQKQEQYDDMIGQLSLYRNNSTFPTYHNLEQNQLGQNVYLTQLVSFKSRQSTTQPNKCNIPTKSNKYNIPTQDNKQNIPNQANKYNITNQTKQNIQIIRNSRIVQDDHNRLQQDYQIKQTLDKAQSNKQGYICLNKLQKIFYYVKKMTNLTNQSQYKSQKQASDQIKQYNKDVSGHLLRFYQNWCEKNSIFMIFELGSYSLNDKTLSCQKLSQTQIWQIIYQITSSLKYIYSSQGIHLNVKPGNILKCHKKYKLSDPFISLQNFYEHFSSIRPQQKYYIAPQILQYKKYLNGMDFMKCQVYSLGICLLENVAGRKASQHQIIQYVKRHMNGYSSFLKRLLISMVSRNFTKRPTFDQILCTNIQHQGLNKSPTKQTFKRSNSF